jgi:Rrf2 family transcriptional regulator, nitric oxide-sensitive transcriptional repressor
VTISQTAEYALRAVVWLGSYPDRTFSTLQISQATRTPTGYLSKVLQELARAGLVVSQAGRTGGFTLTRSPAQISVLDVINAVDPIRRIDRCPLNLTSHVELCPLHRRLDNALGMVERAFADSTIAELVAEPTSSTPLCECARQRLASE